MRRAFRFAAALFPIAHGSDADAEGEREVSCDICNLSCTRRTSTSCTRTRCALPRDLSPLVYAMASAATRYLAVVPGQFLRDVKAVGRRLLEREAVQVPPAIAQGPNHCCVSGGVASQHKQRTDGMGRCATRLHEV
jgi:hypothetical protein